MYEKQNYYLESLKISIQYKFKTQNRHNPGP